MTIDKLEKERERQRNKWARMTREQKDARNKKLRESGRHKKKNMSEERRAKKRIYNKMWARSKRASMTDEQLAKSREYWRVISQNRRNRLSRDEVDAFRKRRRKYMKKIHAENMSSRIAHNVRNRVWSAIKYNGKAKKTSELLGCSIELYKTYIESKWLDGMSWSNYGKGGWHIDHIKPCASFDLTDHAQQLVCFHFTNTQPLWEFDNLSKGQEWSLAP